MVEKIGVINCLSWSTTPTKKQKQSVFDDVKLNFEK